MLGVGRCAGSHDTESGCLQEKQPSLGNGEFSQVKESCVIPGNGINEENPNSCVEWQSRTVWL